MTPRRVVAVLSGGGAKGAAHLGAMRALAEAGIVPMHYVGTSMGAGLAAALAAGTPPAVVQERLAATRRDEVLRIDRLSLLKGWWGRAMFRPEPFRASVERMLGGARRFADLPVPCTITAVDADSGAEVVFGAGGEDVDLVDAVTAACAIPPYFPPVVVNGKRCIDGGVRDVVPLDRAAALGADLVVAIHVGPGFDQRGEPAERHPAFVAATDAAIGWLMARNVELARAAWERRSGAPPLLWIRPVTDRGATFAMERIPVYAEAGYTAMRQGLETLR